MDFVAVFDRVASFLETHGGFRVAVVGGLGLHAHGVTRATVDLDLTVEAAAQPGLVGFLESLGYETLHRSAGYSNHFHPDSRLGRLDVVYLEPGTAARLFAGCVPRLPLGARTALVPRAEHLVTMKVQAMKNDPRREVQDLADLQALLRLTGRTGTRSKATSRRPACSTATMPSHDRSEPLDLDEGLPTSPADVEALHRLRQHRTIATADYLRFLSLLTPPRPEDLRARPGPRGPEPFRL